MRRSIPRSRGILLAAIAPLLGAIPINSALANPQGGQVVAGSAQISSAGSTLLVRQSSNRAVINWSGFSIDPSETVQFVLPSSASAVLNRVTSLSPSQLNGTILSNGNVYLINSNGILLGPHGQINVNGFVASTLDVNNESFMAGGDLLFTGDSTATVLNQGGISAAGGNVVLMARRVTNAGQITAPGGSVALAGGTEVLLQQAGNPGVTVRVMGEGSVTNTGAIQATVAQLAANGGNALALAINNTGIIRATGVRNANGHIYLTAGGTGEVDNSGTLDASSNTGKGGQIIVTGHDILIEGQSHLSANGATGGGEVLVGGSWQNDDPSIAQAVGTIVLSGAVLEASATASGDGGIVVARSDVSNPDSFTRADGAFFAQGGPAGGNGGRIETSGYSLDTTGAIISTSAPKGQAGQWLLDPYDLTISGSATSNFNVGGSPWVPTASGGNVAASDIDAALDGGSDVTISTGASGGDIGNIVVNAAIIKAGGLTAVTLTLDANNNVTVNQPISASSGQLNIVLDAHFGAAGVITLGADLTTNGGSISFGTGRTSAGLLIGGDVFLDEAGAQTLSTSGGAVTVYGQMLIANSSGLTINTAGGAVDFKGTVDSGDLYTLVNSNVTWDSALVLAKGSTGGGAAIGDTYLATITSSLENAIAGAAANYSAAWLGGHRVIGIGTNAVWRWVTGPEGLQDGGNGLQFFTENFTGGGGTAIGGAYTNWNGGEPNNSGGANINSNGESVIQFVGTAGQWNDLPENSSTLPYLVETNLAPSPLTVNAGAGQITFRGLVGSNKALASLTTTGPVAMNGGGVTTTGAQTYNNPITLGSSSTILQVTSADLNIGQNISYPGSTAAGLTLQASGSVILAPSTAIAASGTGALNVTIDTHNDAGVDSGNSGAIVLGSGSSITSNGGNIILGGGVSPATTPAYGTSTNVNGIDLNDATLNSSGGAITLNGNGVSGTSSAGVGVLIDASSSITGASGAISITGTGGSNTASGNDGVLIQAASTLTSTSGGITLTGTGGAAGTSANDGISFEGSSTLIQSTGSAPISLTGTPGTGSAGVGIFAAAPASIGGAADTGNITITSDSVSFDNSGAPVTFQSSGQLLIQPNTSSVSIGLGAGATGNLLLGSTALGNIHSGFSQVILGSATGTGAIVVGTATIDDPITIRTPLATANDITVSGTLSTVAASESATLQSGRSVIVSSGTIDTNDAAVTLDADSNSIHQGNIQLIDAAIATSGGAITLGGGAAPATTAAWGINSPGSIAAASGVFVNHSTLTSTGGNISIRGTGSTAGTPNDAAGVMIEYLSSIDSGTGTVAVTGIGPTSGATGNMGVNIRYQDSLGAGGTAGATGSAITSANTSASAVAITGTGAISTALNSAGVTLQNGSTVTATGTGGGIIINGAGGTFADNSSPGNQGISLDANTTISSTGGNVTLNAGAPAGIAAINNFNSGSRTISANATSGIITLNPTSGGANLGSTILSGDKLLLTGSGTFTLTDASNSVGTLAASVAGGNVQFTNGGGLTIGSIGGTTGLTDTGGTVTVVAQGASSDLTLDNNVAGVGSGSSVVLAAGRNFLNSGSATISTGAGRFLVYSTSPLDSVLGGLTGGEIYASTFSGNPPSGITASGNQFLYSLAPTLTFTATDQTKMYSQTNPSLTYSVAGLVGTDTIGQATTGSPLISTAATSSSGVGNYAINATAGSLVSSIGYALSFVPGQLSVTAAPLTITAVDKSNLYGAALPTFTANYTGLVNGDGTGAISGLNLSTPATASSNVGAYNIIASGATSPNYNITVVPGTLTITQAPLTITAADKSKAYGAALPALTANYVGLVNGDGPGAISGLSLSTSASSSSNVGAYGITASGATSDNYSITMFPGTLAITQAPLTIIAADKIRDASAPNPPLTARFLGLANNDPPSAIAGVVLSTTAQSNSPVGVYPIVISGGTNTNYAITLANGSMFILDGFTQGLRNQWQTEAGISPNFSAVAVTQTSSMPTAESDVTFKTSSPAAHFGEVNIFYRDLALAKITDSAKLSFDSGKFLLAAIAHVSSYDLNDSSGKKNR